MHPAVAEAGPSRIGAESARAQPGSGSQSSSVKQTTGVATARKPALRAAAGPSPSRRRSRAPYPSVAARTSAARVEPSSTTTTSTLVVCALKALRHRRSGSGLSRVGTTTAIWGCASGEGTGCRVRLAPTRERRGGRSRYRPALLMDALEAIVLGLVQGLTEFLPISSSGHLLIVPAIAGWEDPGAAFTAVIQLGTMAAVLLYFRADLWRITVAFLRSLRAERWRSADLDARIGWYIALGTIPIGIFGFVFADQIESGTRSLYLVGTTLILFSFVMLAAERAGRRERGLDSLTARDGAIIGLFQALALIPGVSRSGATISAGLFQGLDRTAAARYSFLLSVPAVVISGLFELRKVADGGGAGVEATLVAALIAFISGYAAIAWLLRFVANHSIGAFCPYRIALGATVIVLAATGAIAPA